MEARVALVFCLLVNGVISNSELKFPKAFKFGSATSSYQIEGGWNASDKAPSVWDTFVHDDSERILDRSNGDVACDSYNRWQQDVKMASDLGLDFYRFSISWPRILPKGTTEYISEEGASYYNNLINGLLEEGIEPVVTMYHWDLPQRLQNLGGWTNPLIADWFGNYSRVLYKLYGDRVKTWLTVNEPIVICTVTFSMDIIPPGFSDPDIGVFQCMKNLMMAHATAYNIYDKDFRPKFGGRVGLTNQIFNLMPATKEDEELTELAMQFYAGIYSHPIYSKTGGWPPNIEKVIEENSKAKGWDHSRLPSFTDAERDFVKRTADFYGLNYYTSKLVKKAPAGTIFKHNSFNNIPELGVYLVGDPSWEQASSFWFHIYPEGIRNVLQWINKSFGDVEIIIFENGLSTAGSNLRDTGRVLYYKEHLEQILLAIHEDGINITGYTAWSLMDNFEWVEGYTTKFGLYEVDFSSPERTRTPRDSAHYYRHVIRSRSTHNNKYITDEL